MEDNFILHNLLNTIKGFSSKDWMYIGGFVVLWVGMIIVQFAV